MKILSLAYADHTRNWKLEEMDFRDRALLVGVSGSGKTQILRSILTLRDIAMGKSVNGVKWTIVFNDCDRARYCWDGEFECLGEAIDEGMSRRQPRIVSERLLKDDLLLIGRRKNDIIYRGCRIVNLPREISVVNLLREEQQVSAAYRGFASIEEVGSDFENAMSKIYLASKKAKGVFRHLVSDFVGIFPYVEDVRVGLGALKDSMSCREVPIIQIRERGVDKWIDQEQISSGMLRTLIHLSQLHLCADGSVILIDEFENSLGANCIQELTEEAIDRRTDLQFILTSHHPYIINNIPMKDWKIVTRNAGVVTARNAADIRALGKSKHEAYMQLINLPEYLDGIIASF